MELDRVLARLATLGPARLSRPGAPGPGPIGSARPSPEGGGSQPVSPADLVRPLLQHLADLAADAQGRRRRAVPALADRAVPDQLVVLAADVLDLTGPADGLGVAPPPSGTVDLDDVATRLRALRRALP